MVKNAFHRFSPVSNPRQWQWRIYIHEQLEKIETLNMLRLASIRFVSQQILVVCFEQKSRGCHSKTLQLCTTILVNNLSAVCEINATQKLPPEYSNTHWHDRRLDWRSCSDSAILRSSNWVLHNESNLWRWQFDPPSSLFIKLPQLPSHTLTNSDFVILGF